MESINILISISIPMLLMCTVLKGRSRKLIIFLLLGVLAAILSGFINSFILAKMQFDRFYLTVNISPIIEETIKAIPILIFAFAFKPERQALLESAISCGLGFAMYENIFLLLQTANLSLSLAVLRGFGAGLMHSICTLTVAFGVSFMARHRGWFISGTVALLATSMTFHSLYNILIQSNVAVLGVVLPMCAYIPILAFTLHNKTDLKN